MRDLQSQILSKVRLGMELGVFKAHDEWTSVRRLVYRMR